MWERTWDRCEEQSHQIGPLNYATIRFCDWCSGETIPSSLSFCFHPCLYVKARLESPGRWVPDHQLFGIAGRNHQGSNRPLKIAYQDIRAHFSTKRVCEIVLLLNAQISLHYTRTRRIAAETKFMQLACVWVMRILFHNLQRAHNSKSSSSASL